MNIFATPAGTKAPPSTIQPTASKEERMQQTALTTARAQAKKLCDGSFFRKNYLSPQFPQASWTILLC
jgi:hypothetical protein